MRKLLKFIRRQKVNWFKTFIVNFKCLPISQARHLPIHIYSDTIVSSYGHIVINADEITFGMVKIGRRNFFNGYKTYFVNSGTIGFCGRALIEHGSTINNMGGYLKFGQDVMIGEVCKLLCMKQITVGQSSQIAFGTVIMDTDFHTVVDTNEKKVRRSVSAIKIGAFNWFGNNCHIMKGTVTPDFAIATAKSLLNKDYSQYPMYSVFGGTPAKRLAEGKRRVFNRESCKLIDRLFDKDRNCKSVVLADEIVDWDAFCLGGDEVLFTEG